MIQDMSDDCIDAHTHRSVFPPSLLRKMGCLHPRQSVLSNVSSGICFMAKIFLIPG